MRSVSATSRGVTCATPTSTPFVSGLIPDADAGASRAEVPATCIYCRLRSAAMARRPRVGPQGVGGRGEDHELAATGTHVDDVHSHRMAERRVDIAKQR